MSRFNTGNALGSGDPRDLDDNAKNADLAVNSDELRWSDRFGRDRKSFEGMEREFDSAQTYRESRFNDFIASSGYQFLDDYGPGIEITEYNQLVRDESGEFWRVSGQVDLPYVTTGAGIPEGDALAPAGDAVLRQDLANPDIGAAMVARGVVAVDSIADLLALPEGQRKEGLRYLVKGYHAGSDVGGGEFYWDPAFEGGNSVTSFGSGTGFGAFIRVPRGHISPADAGCVQGADSTQAITNLLNSAANERLLISPETKGEVYMFSGDIKIEIPNQELKIDGKGLKLLSTDGSIWFTGSSELLTSLSSPAQLTESSILVEDASGIANGDMLAICNPIDYSFSLHRPYYKAGEFVKVLSIDSSKLVLGQNLRDSYPSNISNVYKIMPMRITAEDFHVFAEGKATSFRVSLCEKTVLKDCTGSGGFMRGLMLDKSSGGEIIRGSYECTAPAGAGGLAALQYGISFNFCEDFKVSRSYCFGTRHPIATSGYETDVMVVNRRLVFESCILESSTPNVHGPDLHGNSEDCHYIDCHSNHGVGLAGQNCSWVGGTIGALEGSDRRPMAWHEITGGDIVYRGVSKTVVPPGQRAFGAAAAAYTQNTERNFRIIIDDVFLDFQGTPIIGHGILACESEMVERWDAIISNIRHAPNINVSRVLTLTKASGTTPISSLRIEGIDGWDDFDAVMLNSNGALGADSKLYCPPFYRDLQLTLEAGGVTTAPSAGAVPYPTVPRTPLIKLSNETPFISMQSGSVLAKVFTSTIGLGQCNVQLSTGDTSYNAGSSVSVSVKVAIQPV